MSPATDRPLLVPLAALAGLVLLALPAHAQWAHEIRVEGGPAVVEVLGTGERFETDDSGRVQPQPRFEGWRVLVATDARGRRDAMRALGVEGVLRPASGELLEAGDLGLPTFHGQPLRIEPDFLDDLDPPPAPPPGDTGPVIVRELPPEAALEEGPMRSWLLKAHVRASRPLVQARLRLAFFRIGGEPAGSLTLLRKLEPTLSQDLLLHFRMPFAGAEIHRAEISVLECTFEDGGIWRAQF